MKAGPGKLLRLDLQPGRPPVLQLSTPDDATDWAVRHRDRVRELVTEHGSLLVRGLGMRDRADTAVVLHLLAAELMVETETFASRTPQFGGLYSSSAWPSTQPMCMHHEQSYALEFPGLLLFACLTAPSTGGATTVADSAALLDSLPVPLVERFEREGWLLTRSYNGEIGASLAEAFGSDDGEAVERYCRAHAIEYEWRPDGALRTRQRRSAVVRHPVTGRRCWFNQVAFLNEWTLAPSVREFLVDEYGGDGLPFNTFFGNGEPIDADVVELLNRSYEAATSREAWQDGDILLVDNVRTAHAREPFEGPREILVGLADPVRLVDCAPTVEVNPG